MEEEEQKNEDKVKDINTLINGLNPFLEIYNKLIQLEEFSVVQTGNGQVMKSQNLSWWREVGSQKREIMYRATKIKEEQELNQRIMKQILKIIRNNSNETKNCDTFEDLRENSECFKNDKLVGDELLARDKLLDKLIDDKKILTTLKDGIKKIRNVPAAQETQQEKLSKLLKNTTLSTDYFQTLIHKTINPEGNETFETNRKILLDNLGASLKDKIEIRKKEIQKYIIENYTINGTSIDNYDSSDKNNDKKKKFIEEFSNLPQITAYYNKQGPKQMRCEGLNPSNNAFDALTCIVITLDENLDGEITIGEVQRAFGEGTKALAVTDFTEKYLEEIKDKHGTIKYKLEINSFIDKFLKDKNIEGLEKKSTIQEKEAEIAAAEAAAVIKAPAAAATAPAPAATAPAPAAQEPEAATEEASEPQKPQIKREKVEKLIEKYEKIAAEEAAKGASTASQEPEAAATAKKKRLEKEEAERLEKERLEKEEAAAEEERLAKEAEAAAATAPAAAATAPAPATNPAAPAATAAATAAEAAAEAKEAAEKHKTEAEEAKKTAEEALEQVRIAEEEFFKNEIEIQNKDLLKAKKEEIRVAVEEAKEAAEKAKKAAKKAEEARNEAINEAAKSKKTEEENKVAAATAARAAITAASRAEVAANDAAKASKQAEKAAEAFNKAAAAEEERLAKEAEAAAATAPAAAATAPAPAPATNPAATAAKAEATAAATAAEAAEKAEAVRLVNNLIKNVTQDTRKQIEEYAAAESNMTNELIELKKLNEEIIEQIRIIKSQYLNDIQKFYNNELNIINDNDNDNLLKNITITNITDITNLNKIIIYLLKLYGFKFKNLQNEIEKLLKYNKFFNIQKEKMKQKRDNEKNYFVFTKNEDGDIFERTKVKLFIDNKELSSSSINVIDNEDENDKIKGLNKIKNLNEQLKKKLEFTENSNNGNFIEVYDRYADDYNKYKSNSENFMLPLIGAGPKQNAGGFYPEYPYQPIQVNRNTAIYRFILPVIVFKAFRIILYKKLLEKNKNAFVFKNILTDISLSFALIIALNLMGLSKIASLLFSDLLISVVLIYIVLYMYDCADEKKKEVNIKNIINTLILAPFFVMYVK